MNGDRIGYRAFEGTEALATRGEPVYGEEVAEGWRRWSAGRSKLAGMLDRGMDIELDEGTRVLYLGAASGTTVSHLGDVVDVVYAVEFAPRPMADLLEVAEDRTNVIPLLKDARRPSAYAHVVEANLDLIVQDVATRDQAGVALANRQFLAPDGQLALAIKARSEDVTAPPEETFDAVVDRLGEEYVVKDRTSLAPTHRDHEAVLAGPRG